MIRIRCLSLLDLKVRMISSKTITFSHHHVIPVCEYGFSNIELCWDWSCEDFHSSRLLKSVNWYCYGKLSLFKMTVSDVSIYCMRLLHFWQSTWFPSYVDIMLGRTIFYSAESKRLMKTLVIGGTYCALYMANSCRMSLVFEHSQ